MSGVIKTANADLVRALDARAPNPRPSAEALRIQSLEREVGVLEQALRDNNAQHLEELAAARDAGRADAERAFELNEEKRLNALERGIEQAIDEVRTRLGAAETLALTFTMAALENLVAEPQARRALIAGAIARQAAGLRQGTIMSIAVSGEDFADDEALQNLSRQHSLTIQRDADLGAGVCRLEARLGGIDISLPRFTEEVRACCVRLAASP